MGRRIEFMDRSRFAMGRRIEFMDCSRFAMGRRIEFMDCSRFAMGRRIDLPLPFTGGGRGRGPRDPLISSNHSP
jgi:hypothetical protein